MLRFALFVLLCASETNPGRPLDPGLVQAPPLVATDPAPEVAGARLHSRTGSQPPETEPLVRAADLPPNPPTALPRADPDDDGPNPADAANQPDPEDFLARQEPGIAWQRPDPEDTPQPPEAAGATAARRPGRRRVPKAMHFGLSLPSFLIVGSVTSLAAFLVMHCYRRPAPINWKSGQMPLLVSEVR
jgi:hypothetical protein